MPILSQECEQPRTYKEEKQSMLKQDESRINLRFWHHCVIFLFACVILISRRPDAIFHIQPYAEDGHVWYADAYNLGWWPSLFHTWTGYFLTLPRLAASLSLLAPFYLFPLILNLIAIFFQALPVNLLLSTRSSGWGDLRFRGLLAFAYLALPNCGEMSRGITLVNFLIALSALLLLVAHVPQTNAGRIADFCIVLLFGLSGPFCIFMLPISIYLAWTRRESWRWVQVGVVAASCLIQIFALLFLAPTARAHRALGASAALFARILAGQVYLGALLGSNNLASLPATGVSIFLICVAIGGSALVIWCLLKAPLPIRIFILFSGMVFFSSLIAPVEWARPDVPVWRVLAWTGMHRYWFFPSLAFVWCLLWCFQRQNSLLKIASGGLLVVMCFGVIHGWRHQAFPDVHFAESARRFEAAPAGTVVIIPENPPGWNMRLVKRGTQ